MVAAVVWSIAVIGVRTRAVSVGWAAIVAIPRAIAVAVRMGRGDSARGDGAGGEAECEARTDTAAARFSGRRRRDCGHADGRNGSQNCQCLPHHEYPPSYLAQTTPAHCDGCASACGTELGKQRPCMERARIPRIVSLSAEASAIWSRQQHEDPVSITDAGGVFSSTYSIGNAPQLLPTGSRGG